MATASVAELTPQTVEAWHVQHKQFVLDNSDQPIAWANDPELARAIAQGGGYTLPKPTGPMAETTLAWDDASRRQMAQADSWDAESWPGQVTHYADELAGLEPMCESSIFETDAKRRRAIITTAVEAKTVPELAFLEAAADALKGLLVKDSIEARLLDQVLDGTVNLYARAIEVTIEATDAMGAKCPGDVEPEELTRKAMALLAKL